MIDHPIDFWVPTFEWLSLTDHETQNGQPQKT